VWIWPPLAFGRALLDGCADLTSQSPWSYFLSDAGIFWAAGVTLLLLARGRSSPHLRSATGCALTIWLYSISAACNCLFTCRLGNVSQVTRIFDYLSSFFCFAGWVWIPVLVMTRISALEASMGQPLGLWEMRWVIFVTAVTTALCVIVVVYSWSLEFVPLPVIYVLASAYGVSSVLYLTFTGLVVRAFCTPLRLLREMHNAGYISKETWAAAVSLGQLQIGGLLASTTSTVLSAGSIIFGSALQLAKHDESGRDMFTYVAIPLWLDIIANSTCVLFLSGAVHMPNAVLGNALARQRNRAALLGNSMSVVDRKWHAKVSELAERGFTLESLLSFYKRLGTDYMLHYKPDVHRTSDVVRQAIIPLSRPSGVAYAVTMMKGACSLPDAIVTHNWGNLFRDLVAGICADALGLSEYALVSELLDCDVVALESMLANSGKIQKTYWTISAGDLDPVHGTEHPTCDCGRPKCFNNTPEVALGRSVHCELNKFDDMMGHIAQIDVVDGKFDLFTRAWCVAEVAEAFRIGMPQNLKIKCGQLRGQVLHAFEERLRFLKVQEMEAWMEASRPEDVAEILAKIPDKDAFNAQLQTLIFDEHTGLLTQWRILDTTEQLRHFGLLALSGALGEFYAFLCMCTDRESKDPPSAAEANTSMLASGRIRVFGEVLQMRWTNYDFVDFCHAAGVNGVAAFPSYQSVFDKVGGIITSSVNERRSVSKEVVQQSMEEVTWNEEADLVSKAWRIANPGRLKDPYQALLELQPMVVLYNLMAQVPAFRYEGSHGAPAISVCFTSSWLDTFVQRQPPRPSLFATSAVVDSSLPVTGWTHITGVWLMQEDLPGEALGDGAALGGLRRFVQDGEKPVAIGWGSMMAKGHPPVRMLAIALRALKTAGKRGVILGGWAKLHELGKELVRGGLAEIGPDRSELASFAASQVFFMPHAPHSWLLQHSCCAVHHGGAGTTYAALRASCPAVVTPFFGDQFQFAQRVEQLGAGVSFLRAMPQITHFELATAILEAEAQGFPSELSRRLKKERGAEHAADAVEGFLEDWVQTGRFAEARAEIKASPRVAVTEGQPSGRGGSKNRARLLPVQVRRRVIPE
ncbi:unnamed protein product, partial [Polarella glacialis]